MLLPVFYIYLELMVVVGAVRPSTRSSPSCPVCRKRVGVGLEFSLDEERRSGVSSARTGARPWAWPGTGPKDRLRLWRPG